MDILSTRARRFDLAIGVMVGLFQVTDVALAHGPLAAYGLAVVATVAVALRQRFPRTLLLVSIALVLAYGLLGVTGMVAAVPLLLAVFTAIDEGHWPLMAVLVTPLIGLLIAQQFLAPDGRSFREIFQAAVLPIGWFVASAVVGAVSRQRRAYIHQVEQRALEAERSREDAALRRAGQERLRIARELHDSLTHSISVIKVQAGVAVHLARKRGEEVPAALEAIQEASTVATRELRETLEVLRDPGEEVRGNGLRNLAELLSRTRAAGLPVELTVEGAPGVYPVEVDLAAYRIVQEALTNVARHAGPATAKVRIEHGDGELSIRVVDDGQPHVRRPYVPGIGLSGMRERVADLGGSLDAGPRPEGGFAVHAVLPSRRLVEAR